ncbi:DUF2147 domain-containing protein [Bradyrhizobium sp.]|uniref:DUF2147 domain-containing protein n=1 Tax=Bradyrhizobium sp. TaxID=376 RepID=UPI00403791BA
MKKLLAAAALLLASGTAQAQYTFEYGGKTIRIDPDRGTVQIPGVYDNTKKAKKNEDASKSKEKPTTTTAAPPAAALVEQQPAAAAAAPPPPAAAAPSAVAAPATPPIQAPVPPPLGAASASPATSTAAAAPTDNSAAAQPSVAPPPPAAAPAPPSSTVAVAPPPAAPPVPPPAPKPAPAAVVASNTPIGVWLTEEKEGRVRIEQCGANLCGYSVDKKTNQNGEQVLINMKPGKDKWSGRILDPTTGSTYDSTIAMKGTETLRVQGCAFGGVFCGGQIWTRVN